MVKKGKYILYLLKRPFENPQGHFLFNNKNLRR